MTRERKRNLPVPLDFPQQSYLIEHTVGDAIVPQRPRDGYINATRLCQQAGKRFSAYHRNAVTQAFLRQLALEVQICTSNLVQVIRGRGNVIEQGTWVHPQVALNLAQWLSPSFAVQVTKWVLDWFQGKTYDFMPMHVRRFLINRAKVPHTHFSMLNEIYLNLLAPLEDHGVILPDKMMPDISTGLMFSSFLRSKGIEPNSFDTYDHEFMDGIRPVVKARMYPVEHLPEFRRFFNEVWLPERAKGYFEERYPKVVPLLPRIQQLPAP